MIRNTDQRSKDYGDIHKKFRPGHADITYYQKYGNRDYRGGGRSSARETAARVAAGGVAREALKTLLPDLKIIGYMVQMGQYKIDRNRFDLAEIETNPFWTPDPAMEHCLRHGFETSTLSMSLIGQGLHCSRASNENHFIRFGH